MLGAGMLKVVLTLCTTVGIMDASGLAYQIFYAVSDAFYYFLPVFLGWSIAQKVGGSIPLFMSLGAMFCYPSLVTLMGGAVEDIEYGTFLGSQCTYLLSAVSWDW